jgi:hypothetical protein
VGSEADGFSFANHFDADSTDSSSGDPSASRFQRDSRNFFLMANPVFRAPHLCAPHAAGTLSRGDLQAGASNLCIVENAHLTGVSAILQISLASCRRARERSRTDVNGRGDPSLRGRAPERSNTFP